MPIQNEEDAAFLDQSEIDAGDWKIGEAVAGGHWVIAAEGSTAGQVTAQVTPNGTVAVATGQARIGGVTRTITAGNVSVLSGSANPDGSTASAADSTMARFSLIHINSAGNLGVSHGTPADLSETGDGSYDCVFPTWTGKTILASVFIPPTFTAIATSQISDKRVLGDQDAIHDQAHNATGAQHDDGWGGKGHLPTGLTQSTATTTAPGTNGQMLTAQSGQTSGLQYATVYTDKTWVIDGVLPATLVGTKRWRNRTGRTLTFDRVELEVTTAPTTQAILVDVFVDGTTIWSTQGNRANIQAGQTNGSQTTFNTTTIATGSYITVDLEQAGTGTTGANLTVTVWLKG